jgi:hypothetical protein
MNSARTAGFFSTICLLGVLLVPGAAMADQVTFGIGVDTSSLQGDAGFLDFQFGAGNMPFDPASVTISGFTSDGTLIGGLGIDVFGDVTGSLPGNIVLNAMNPSSEYTQSFNFGSFFDVFVTLDVSVSGTAAFDNTFFLSVWDADFNPQLTASGAPALLEIDLDGATGAPSIENFSSENQAVISGAPEPASLVLLLGAGLGGAVAIRRRRAQLS